MRKLMIWSAPGIGVLVVMVAVSSVALHTYGSHRLAEARAELDARWGHLTQIEPPPSVPDYENGARWLVAGGRAIVVTTEDRRFYGQLSDRSATGWTDTERSRARWILHEQQNALEILLRSQDFESFNLGTDGVEATYDEIDFPSVVIGLRLLALEARLAWIEGRTTDSLAALSALGRSADGLLKTPIVMTSTIGSAATRWAAMAAADIVSDPCIEIQTLDQLLKALPREDPMHAGNTTLAVAVAEIAAEGLDYIGDDFYDPSMGWSIPVWVSNHYLFEDLYVAEIIERWGLQLELGQEPAAQWSPDAGHRIWGESSWSSWLALAATSTPNLMGIRARVQAASTQIQHVKLATEIRLAASRGTGADACRSITESSLSPLTGEPFTCRHDEELGVFVVEVPGALEAVALHYQETDKPLGFPPIPIPLGNPAAGCEQALTAPEPTTATASR